MITREQIRNIRPERLKEFKEMKMTNKEIAKLCGVTEATIYNRFKELRKKSNKKTAL